MRIVVYDSYCRVLLWIYCCGPTHPVLSFEGVSFFPTPADSTSLTPSLTLPLILRFQSSVEPMSLTEGFDRRV